MAMDIISMIAIALLTLALLTEGLSTGRFDSDQGDLFYNSMPKKESPSVGGVPGVTGAPGVTGCTWSDPVYPVYPVLPGTGSRYRSDPYPYYRVPV